GAQPPARPDSKIAVLLEAPVFGPRLGEWFHPQPGRVAVLVGHVADWDHAGVTPDFRPELPESAAILRHSVEEVKVLAACGNADSELAYLNAAGVDLPEAAITDPTNPACPFLPLQDSHGYPLPFRSLDAGQWLARDVLGQLPIDRLMGVLDRHIPEIERA